MSLAEIFVQRDKLADRDLVAWLSSAKKVRISSMKALATSGGRSMDFRGMRRVHVFKGKVTTSAWSPWF